MPNPTPPSPPYTTAVCQLARNHIADCHNQGKGETCWLCSCAKIVLTQT